MHEHFPRYSKRLIGHARRLRREMTDAERKLWSILRGSQADVKFRRQVPYRSYILDFYSSEVKLNIEVDGSQHNTEEGMAKDRIRDAELQADGIEVMRFSDRDVLRNIAGVGEAIYVKLKRFLDQDSESSSK
jgi:very-short-patch-repair endonuclease